MKIVLKAALYDDRIKQKAMKAVSGLSGFESLSVDMKDQQLSIVGDIDPVVIVTKLRTLCFTQIVSIEDPKKKKQDEKEKVIEVLKPYEVRRGEIDMCMKKRTTWRQRPYVWM